MYEAESAPDPDKLISEELKTPLIDSDDMVLAALVQHFAQGSPLRNLPPSKARSKMYILSTTDMIKQIKESCSM